MGVPEAAAAIAAVAPGVMPTGWADIPASAHSLSTTGSQSVALCRAAWLAGTCSKPQHRCRPATPAPPPPKQSTHLHGCLAPHSCADPPGPSAAEHCQCSLIPGVLQQHLAPQLAQSVGPQSSDSDGAGQLGHCGQELIATQAQGGGQLLQPAHSCVAALCLPAAQHSCSWFHSELPKPAYPNGILQTVFCTLLTLLRVVRTEMVMGTTIEATGLLGRRGCRPDAQLTHRCAQATKATGGCAARQCQDQLPAWHLHTPVEHSSCAHEKQRLEAVGGSAGLAMLWRDDIVLVCVQSWPKAQHVSS